MADDSIDTRPPTALPATLAAAVPRLAESLALLDDAHHLVISVKGSKRYVQFAAFGPNLRGESVGNTYLRGPAQLGVGDLLWLADHLAAATVALVTLHAVHGVDHVGQLVFQSEDPRVIDAFAGGVGVTARDRAVGALVGLAVGDAVGTTVEFAAPGTFEPITDMVGGGPFGLRPGQWTDDTSMAMCLGESLLDTGGFDAADQLRRYAAWRRHGYWSATGRCFDIGGTTARALDRFERDGTVVDSVVDEDAAANGSLMRLAPVPIRWHADIEEAAERAGESSRTTHPAQRPVDACRVYGAMTAALIQGAAIDSVFDPGFWQFGPLDPRVEAVVRGSWRHKQPPEIRGSGYVVDALEAALWAVAGASDFRDAVLRAANLGDDADTTAAIAGQLAGARWGCAGIPVEWRTRLAEGDRIEAIAGRLHDLGAGTGPTHPWPHDGLVHGYWVEPGRVLAGEYPGDLDPERAARKVNLLVDHGVRTFVDLTDGPHLEPYDHIVRRAASSRNLDLVHISQPVPDMGVIDPVGYDAIVAAIRSSAERGGVYLHCWGGIGRTATVVGCLLVDDGLDADAALARIDELRSVTRKAHMAAPQTPAQIDVIRARAKIMGR